MLSLWLASSTWAAAQSPPLAPELEPRLQATPGNDNNDYSSTPHFGDPASDPPARVGRLNAMTDVVSLRPQGQSEFVAAVRNRPIVQGDSLYTGPSGRAEMHMGPHVVRLGPNTLLTVAAFDDEQLQLSVPQGVVMVRIRELVTGEIVELDTPGQALVVQHEGVFRIDVDADGAHLRLAARRGGEADVIGAAQTWSLHSDELAQIDGADAKQHTLSAAPAFDALDQWGANRDQSEERPEALKFVSRDTVGYEDLDANGNWEQTQDFGAVWYPTSTDADWAPYRDGSWSYIAPWGWSWIDEAAWGFAPFHYGRWINGGNRWGWAPGQLGPRPCYAPALVGFLGGPELGFDGETLAWFPLGWGEAYWPSYRASYGYVHRVNQAHYNTTHGHTTQSSYANQRVPGAVTAVRNGVVTQGSVIGRNHLQLSVAAQSKGRFLGSSPRLSPAQKSVVHTGENASTLQPRAALLQRSVATAVRAYAPKAHSAQSTGPIISSGSGAQVHSYDTQHHVGTSAGGNGAVGHNGQVYRYPQIYRTPTTVGPHNDPRGSYSRPASGSYNAGAAVYNAAPNYQVPANTGGNVGGYRSAPNVYSVNPGRRYEPVNRPAPAAAPVMHPSAMPGHFGGHFGGRR